MVDKLFMTLNLKIDDFFCILYLFIGFLYIINCVNIYLVAQKLSCLLTFLWILNTCSSSSNASCEYVHTSAASVLCVMVKHLNVTVCLTTDQDSQTGNTDYFTAQLHSLNVLCFYCPDSCLGFAFCKFDSLWATLMKITANININLICVFSVLLPSLKCAHHVPSCFGTNGVTFGCWHGIVRRDYTITSCTYKSLNVSDNSAGTIGESG